MGDLASTTSDIDEEFDWAETSYVAAFYEHAKKLLRILDTSTSSAGTNNPLLVPKDDCRVGYGGSSYPTADSTEITRSGTTCTVPVQDIVEIGDTLEIFGADQAEYNGSHIVTGFATLPSWRATFEITGAPTTPSTGNERVWSRRHENFGIAVLQQIAINSVTQFVNPVRGVDGHEILPVFPSVYALIPTPGNLSYTLAEAYAEAGIHADGFRRRKPREINSTTATVDQQSNARANGQRAWLTSGTNRGMLHEFDGAAWVCSNTSKSVTTLTRSGTTATATVTAHKYPTGSTVIIAGASVAHYNGTKTITVVDANTFTYTVLASGASPASGTKTAKRQVLEKVDVLDSASAVPNKVPYGVHQSGDYITSTNWNETRALFLLCKKTARTPGAATGKYKYGDDTDDDPFVGGTLAAAQSAAETEFASYPAPGGNVSGWGAGSHCISPPYPDPTRTDHYAEIEKVYDIVYTLAHSHGSTFGRPMPNVEKTIELFIFSDAPSNFATATGGASEVYDNKGHALEQYKMKSFESVGATSADTHAFTAIDPSSSPPGWGAAASGVQYGFTAYPICIMDFTTYLAS